MVVEAVIPDEAEGGNEDTSLHQETSYSVRNCIDDDFEWVHRRITLIYSFFFGIFRNDT